jgi:hypothetical protein
MGQKIGEAWSAHKALRMQDGVEFLAPFFELSRFWSCGHHDSSLAALSLYTLQEAPWCDFTVTRGACNRI